MDTRTKQSAKVIARASLLMALLTSTVTSQIITQPKVFNATFWPSDPRINEMSNLTMMLQLPNGQFFQDGDFISVILPTTSFFKDQVADASQELCNAFSPNITVSQCNIKQNSFNMVLNVANFTGQNSSYDYFYYPPYGPFYNGSYSNGSYNNGSYNNGSYYNGSYQMPPPPMNATNDSSKNETPPMQRRLLQAVPPKTPTAAPPSPPPTTSTTNTTQNGTAPPPPQPQPPMNATSNGTSQNFTGPMNNTNQTMAPPRRANSSNLIINVACGLRNPGSTTPIKDVLVQLLSKNGTLRASFKAQIGGFMPGRIEFAYINALGSYAVGEKNQSISVTYMNSNPIKAGSKVMMYFPLWNRAFNMSNATFMNATNTSQQFNYPVFNQTNDTRNGTAVAPTPVPTTPGKTVVTAPTKQVFVPEHQLVNPKCSDIYETMNPKMNCSYNNQTQILTIFNAFEYDVEPQTKMTFAVSGFRNPYNGKYVTDYGLAIVDVNDGLIEINQGYDLYYSAYNFGKFARARLSRADNVTTVGELSSALLNFTLGMPIDAGCRVEVVFPFDMPLAQDAFQSISVSGFINAQSIIPEIDPLQNSIAFNGCQRPIEANNSTLVIKINKIRNLPYVGNSAPFIIRLFSLQIYEYYEYDPTTDSYIPTSQFINQPIASTEDFGDFKNSTDSSSDFQWGNSTTQDSQNTTYIMPPPVVIVTPAPKFNLSYTPRDFTPGNIRFFGVEPLNNEGTLGSFAMFNISFAPGNPIPDNSLIQIRFPAELPLTAGSCGLIATSFGFNQDIVECYVEDQVLYLKNIINSEFIINYNNDFPPFSLSFSTGGFNPKSSCTKIGAFRIQTFAIVNDSLAIIDDSNFTAQSKNFKQYVVASQQLYATATGMVSDLVASARGVSYDFKMIVTMMVPKNSTFTLMVPPEIGVGRNGTNVTCQLNFGDVPTNYSALAEVLPMTNQTRLRFKTIFSQGDFNPATSTSASLVQFTCFNFTNPRTVDLIQPFGFSLDDSQGCSIASGVQEPMQYTQIPALINKFNVSQDNTQNGANASYTFTMRAEADLFSNDSINIRFPKEIMVPMNPVCFGDVIGKCFSPFEGALFVALRLAKGIIPFNTTFSFKVGQVRNSISSRPTGPFNLMGIEQRKNGQVVAIPSENIGFQVISGQTPSPAKGSLALANGDLGATTQYTFYYTTVNALPQNVAFKIQYPRNVVVDEKISTCYVTFDNFDNLAECFNDVDNSVIEITSTFLPPIMERTNISITMGNITNPDATSTVSQSFNLTSFEDELFEFPIDRISGNLIPQITKCKAPCATCASSQQLSVCTSCFNLPTVKERFLNGTTCLAACPSGFFADGFKCQKCSPDCKTCNGNPLNCTSCGLKIVPQEIQDPSGTQSPSGSAENTTTIPQQPTTPIVLAQSFLLKNQCLHKCPSEYFADAKLAQCLKCDSTCGTCSGSAKNCTSCVKDSNLPFLQKSSCVGQCEASRIQIGGVCEACKSPCASCSGTVDSCTSCTTGNLLDNKCPTSCPLGTTASNKKCVPCGKMCDKCDSKTPSKCTQCSKPYTLLNSECTDQCPSGYYNKTSVCTKCTAPCLSCPTATTCEVCDTTAKPYLLSNSKCVLTCPAGQVKDQDGKLCIPCTSPCSTCSISPSNCTACLTTSNTPFLVGNSCVDVCKAGMTSVKNVCTACKSPCATCERNYVDRCSSCVSGQFLNTSTKKCVTTCPSGFTADKTTMVCKKTA